MSPLERTSDHEREPQRAPQSEPSMHQTPLYIFMTPEENSGNLLTLPGGALPKGLRGNTVSIIDNASHIIRTHGVDFTPKARGFVHDDESRAHGYAYLVEPAWHTATPEPADFTGEKRWDLMPASPLPNENSPLELHHWTSLLARMQHINYRRMRLNEFRDEETKLPLREAEEAFLRSFGRHILKRTTR